MTAPLIRLDGVVSGYPGRPVLTGAGIELHAGERLGLVGANGSGKSTLLHVMVGLRPTTAGVVEAFGRVRRTESDFREVRARAGLLFQDPDDQLFCPTVLEDVAFGPLNLGRSRAEARAVALRTLADLGLDAFAGRVTHRLSGGEKRLVSLATVLAMEPDVLLLDEPTTGLDQDSLDRLLAILAGRPQAMVIVSHDHHFIERLATRAALLVGGVIRPAEMHTHAHVHSHPHVHAPESAPHGGPAIVPPHPDHDH